MRKTIGVAVLAAFALTAGAAAAPQGDTYTLVANLKARSEVPKPTGVSTSAVGLFTAKAVELANDKVKITWKLTFKNLTGPAAAAHIHLGKPGIAGPVAGALCGPCKNGQKGTVTITHAQWQKVESGGGYVNVHTAKNQGGEIRGQIKSSEVKASASTSGGYGS